MNEIRALLDRAVADYEPPAPRLERVLALVAHRRRHRRGIRVATSAAVVVLGVVLGAVIITNPSHDSGVRTPASPSHSHLPPGWVLYQDQSYRFSVQIPPHWQRLRLTPLDRQNGDLLHLVSRDPPSTNPRCIEPINNLTVSGAQIGIEVREQLVPPTVSVPRLTFGPNTARVTIPFTPRPGCPTTAASSETVSVVTEAGREVDPFVISGPEASTQRRAESYQILNSLHFDGFTNAHPRPRVTPFGPPQIGPPGGIAILNGTGAPGAGATTANVLRGFGYTIVGVGNAAKAQVGTTVACRTGASGDAAALAKRVSQGGAIPRVVPFPSPAPADADCIVTLGR